MNTINSMQNTIFFILYNSYDGIIGSIPRDTFFVERFGVDGVATDTFIIEQKLDESNNPITDEFIYSGITSANENVSFSVSLKADFPLAYTIENKLPGVNYDFILDSMLANNLISFSFSSNQDDDNLNENNQILTNISDNTDYIVSMLDNMSIRLNNIDISPLNSKIDLVLEKLNTFDSKFASISSKLDNLNVNVDLTSLNNKIDELKLNFNSINFISLNGQYGSIPDGVDVVVKGKKGIYTVVASDIFWNDDATCQYMIIYFLEQNGVKLIVPDIYVFEKTVDIPTTND